MPMRIQQLFVLLCFFLLSSSCRTQETGVIEGSVVPAGPGVRITLSRAGQAVRTADAGSIDGKFSIVLAPGTYDVAVYIPTSAYPVTFSGIDIYPGKTTTLPPIETAGRAGTTVLSGTVSPAVTGTKVSLKYEGRERAAVNAAGGRYEFMGLPSGAYTIQASSPGYADDVAEINLSDGRPASQNMRLLYVTTIDGIDWTRKVVHATGRGLYPANAQNPTVKREMARRAALSEAERNLLGMIGRIKTDPEHDVESRMKNGALTVRIQGFVRGFTVVNEQELSDGIKIDVELPLTGPNGLTRYLAD